METRAASDLYDVVIVGGALAGAATATILRAENPNLRILIIERSAAFGRRVGEATVEVSTYFLTRILGLSRHLNEHHLAKQGLRFWFANADSPNIDSCSEIGGRYLARVPAFLVDRAVLDQAVLDQACLAGTDLWRPAKVEKVEIQDGGVQTVHVRRGADAVVVRTRWVIDASGVAALLARQNGWWKANTAHPTTAVWSRWSNVKDLDGMELNRRYPAWADACYGTRGTATNHLMGHGWWAWIIALKGGDVSVGVVFDQRLVDWPEDGSLGQRLKTFLCAHPVGRELMEHAQWQEGDIHWRRNLPYSSTTYAGNGFALVGDAAGFLDPFYSPGLDWLTFTTFGAAELVLAQSRGEIVAARVEKHNRDFTRSYNRWFEAIYLDKYEYLGEFDLMRLAFVLDLGFYYLGVAAQPFRRGRAALLEPIFSTGPSTPFYWLMKAYNRRLACIASDRHQRGVAGCTNDGRRFMFGGFTFEKSSLRPIVIAMLWWFWLELREGWRTWFDPGATAPRPDPVIAAQGLNAKRALRTEA